jgi:hypothetical protein
LAHILSLFFSEKVDFIPMMTKQEKSTEEPRPYGLDKKPKNMRLTPETIRKLKEASRRQGVSEAVYVELALKDRFRKDGIA